MLQSVLQERSQQEGQMQLEALLRSRDQEVSSLSHRSALCPQFPLCSPLVFPPCNLLLHSPLATFPCIFPLYFHLLKVLLS